jgi:FkbM family methyltransferase
MFAAKKLNTKILFSFVTALVVLFAYAYKTDIKYFLYYKSAVPQILSTLRGEVQVDASHVVTTIGGRLTLNGNFPFSLPIIVSTLDTGVSKQIRAVGSWEYRNGATLLKLVKPGDTVVEIGANYGYYALLMGHVLKGNGKIYAFEANPVVYDKLAQSVQLNNMQDTVQLRNIAIADKAADAYIVYDTSDIGTGYLITDAEKLATVKAPWVYKKIDTIPLSAALPADLEKIDILRMDIEGSEYLVLMGAQELIERNPNITIVTEWDNRYLQRFGAVSDLVDYLASQKFRFWSIDKQGLVEMTAEQMLNLATPRDVVISRNEIAV